MTRLRLLSLSLGFVVTTHSASAADLSSSYDWKPMKIGGGGWLVGMDISPTERDLMYVRTDVSGAYRWDPKARVWHQLVTAQSMPADYVAYGTHEGTDSIVTAPKDPDIAYMSFKGQIFRSTNRGDKWTATTFATHKVKMEPNGEGRQEGERLGVDPHNSDVLYYLPIAGPAWTSIDAGATWTQVKGIPAGAPVHGINNICFDKQGGTSPVAPSLTGATVRSSIIYITVDDHGIFRSTDAGATWTNIALTSAGGSPAPGAKIRPRDAKLGPDRNYYVACDNEKGATGAVWKYTPAADISAAGTWTDITPRNPEGGSKSWWDISIDPFDANHLIAMEHGGKAFISTDGGSTYTYHLFHLSSEKIDWMNKQENWFLSVGELAFDPFVKGRLWFAEGFGIWHASIAERPAEVIHWHGVSEGIEEACARDLVLPPGGKPVGAMMDLGGFYFHDPDQYTAQRSQPHFMSGWSLDWCPVDPKFLVAVFRNHLGFGTHPNSSGYSTDGGQTWTRFPAVDKKTLPADIDYGLIAVSAQSPDHLVWTPIYSKLPWYTTDRGATWKPCDVGTVKATGVSQWYTGQKPLCADRVEPDTFYLFTTWDGIYRSTDGGAHFTKMGSPTQNKERFNALLKATPGHAGHLWFSEGDNGGLHRSTDGGATWTAIPDLNWCVSFGFGKSATEGGYPSLYAYGAIGWIPGIYRSIDSGATWEKISSYPLGNFGWVSAIDGDKEVFGKVYLGFSQAGFAYGEVSKQPTSN